MLFRSASDRQLWAGIDLEFGIVSCGFVPAGSSRREDENPEDPLIQRTKVTLQNSCEL